MAFLFQLTVECDNDHETALRVKRCLEGDTITLGGGRTFYLRANDVSRDERGRWWVSVGLQDGDRFLQSSDNSTLLAEAGEKLYEKLKVVHGYRFALVGIEVFQFNDVESLPKLLAVPGLKGLVINKELLQKLNLRKDFVEFCSGYWWLPSDYKYG